LADSCPVKVLDFGGNELATSHEMTSSTIFTMGARSSSTYIRVQLSYTIN